MSENLRAQFAVLPDNLANHLLITVVPLLIGIAISLPLAILATRRPRLQTPLLTIASVFQTIPSLALLALMVPILVGIGAVAEAWFAVEVSALGFLPAVIALTLYSMLPIVRNTVTGIQGVDADLLEAARGVGMTPRQVLTRVELPLAAPVIVAGIRTATVWVAGIATLATPVGQRCLGNYIFQGLQTRNWTAVLFGCIAAAALAITLDALIGALERAVRRRRRRTGWAAGAALLALVLAGLTAPRLLDARGTGSAGDVEPVVVGAKTFTEQHILARLMTDLLDEAGLPTELTSGLGSTIVFEALAAGEVDVYVDYSGTLWANAMGRSDIADADTVVAELRAWLQREHGIRLLGRLGFENAYGLAVTRATADELGLTTLADLRPHAPTMTIGGDYEFFGRPEWEAVRDAYGLSFGGRVGFDSTFMYDAVAQGEVEVISAFTSDGRIVADDLVVLADPRRALPPYDAIVLLSADAASRPGVVRALRPLLDAIDVETMRRANWSVDRDQHKATLGEAAAELRKELPKSN